MVFMTLPPVPDRRLLKNEPVDEEIIQVLLRFGFGRAMIEAGDWDYSVALDGNYFDDNPSASL